MKTLQRVAFVFLALSFTANASVQMERATTVSSSYDARNVFLNPAALGFQTELNGFQLQSAFSYGVQEFSNDEHAIALSLGVLGLGMERLSVAGERFSRYSAALGTALTPYLYAGARYSFTRSDSAAWEGINAFDLGLQVRPHRQFALGFLIGKLNRPEVLGTRRPVEFTLGATVRPWDIFELSADLTTLSDDFGKRFGYQLLAGVEVARGIKLRAGYHNEYEFQAGLQFNFGRASLYSVYQPASSHNGLIAGLQFSTMPFQSAIRPNSIYKIEIGDSLGEMPVRGGLFGKGRPALLPLLRAIDRATKDNSIVMIAVNLESFPLGLAAAEDVYDALWKARDAGKIVEVFLANAGIKEYLIASAATRIYMEPSAELRLAGLKSERYFLKGTLDKIGVEAQFLAKGMYKSAPEMFTRRESTPISREESLKVISIAEKHILELLGRGRKIDKAKWDEVTELALLDAPTAQAEGLIDQVGHYKSMAERWAKNYQVKESLAEKSDALALPRRVAVVVAHGDILGKNHSLLNLVGQRQVTPDRVEKHLKAALGDPRVSAIVLRVSSAGGEVVASEEIAALVASARKEKPVIVSMGDVAASGGYFISAPAEKIFAQPLTLTGSIGVFLGKFNLAGLYKKIDLHKEIVTQSPYPGLLSEDRPWSDGERKIMLRRLDQYYDSFVKYVSKERNLPLPQVEKVAQGRVWMGAEAKDNKLVDAQGGYFDAIEFAADRAGLHGGEYETVVVQDAPGLFELVSGENVISPDNMQSALGILSPGLLEDAAWMWKFRQSPFQYQSALRSLQ